MGVAKSTEPESSVVRTLLVRRITLGGVSAVAGVAVFSSQIGGRWFRFPISPPGRETYNASMVSFRAVLGDDQGLACNGVLECVAVGERLLRDVGTAPGDEVTPTEREVLRLILEGKRSAEIAQIASRSMHTVRSHRGRRMRRLGVRSAVDGAHAAARCVVVACAATAGALR
jgi:DNA-binding CsgD family transcriptional regulator